MINKLKRNYHRVLANYHAQLHNDCLDQKLKLKYLQKAIKHNIKFVELI